MVVINKIVCKHASNYVIKVEMLFFKLCSQFPNENIEIDNSYYRDGSDYPFTDDRVVVTIRRNTVDSEATAKRYELFFKPGADQMIGNWSDLSYRRNLGSMMYLFRFREESATEYHLELHFDGGTNFIKPEVFELFTSLLEIQ